MKIVIWVIFAPIFFSMMLLASGYFLFSVLRIESGLLLAMFAGLCLGLTGATCGFLASRTRSERRKAQYRETLLTDTVDKHFSALSRNLSKAIVVYDYGSVTQDNRYQVLSQFLQSTGFKSTKGTEKALVEKTLDIFIKQSAQRNLQGFNPDNIPTNGIDFEYWVADNLRKFGWIASVTQGSGDQGIDVIAENSNGKIGIHCKLYSAAVGNKSVQEAHAGAVHYGLTKAVVLTNSEFTKSARELAKSTGVVLVSHYDIPQLESILSNGRYH